MTADTPTMRRILLADDNSSLRSSLAMALNGRGFETVEAECGAEALKLGNDERPDLSLLDINMPDMTGVDVLRGWIESGLNFPVIFMTAERNKELRVQAQDLGALCVLDKPFGADEFIGVIQRSLGSA